MRKRLLYVHSRKASFVAIDRDILAERYEVEDLFQPGRVPNPLRVMRGVLRAEAEAEVRAALAELPERTRTVLALRFYDNMDYQTIASTMGLSLGNMKTLIHRGKLALAHKLREREAVAEGKCATRTFRVVGGLGELQLV